MPFTFFAHQVPVLPLKERRPDRWDGLGLVVGSILPDLYYATSGWLFGPFGIPLWTDGHRLDLIVQNCVLPGFVLTVLLRRFAMPVVPLVLPDGGVFHLHDLRFVALARHRWWVTMYSVAVGALSHIVIDAFTHANSPVVEGSPLLRDPLFDVAGHGVALYKLLQFGGHVGGTLLALWMLRRIGERRSMRTWHGVRGRSPVTTIARTSAVSPSTAAASSASASSAAAASASSAPVSSAPVSSAPTLVVPPGSVRTTRIVLAVGTALALGYGIARLGDGAVPAFMAASCAELVVLIVSGAVGRRLGVPLPTASDPLVE